MASISGYLAEYDAYAVYVYNNGADATSRLMKHRLVLGAQLVKELGDVQRIPLTWDVESGSVCHFLVGKADETPEGDAVVVVVHDADGAEQLLDYEYMSLTHDMEEWVDCDDISAEIVRTTPLAAAVQRSRETSSQIGYVEISTHQYGTYYELWNGRMLGRQPLPCPVCLDDCVGYYRAPCGHFVCSTCARNIARLAKINGQFRPSKCPQCRRPM